LKVPVPMRDRHDPYDAERFIDPIESRRPGRIID